MDSVVNNIEGLIQSSEEQAEFDLMASRNIELKELLNNSIVAKDEEQWRHVGSLIKGIGDSVDGMSAFTQWKGGKNGCFGDEGVQLRKNCKTYESLVGIDGGIEAIKALSSGINTNKIGKVAFYLDIAEPQKHKDVALESIINLIRKGDDNLIKMASHIKNRVLSGACSNEIRELKEKLLPVVSFNGIFEKGKKVSNKTFKLSSGLFCIDIDKIYDAGVLQASKEEICQFPGVVACFISPSGTGIKVLMRVDADKILDGAQFSFAFNQFQEYFRLIGYDIDEACKDVRRACYLTIDPDIFYNPDAKVFTLKDYVEPIVVDRSGIASDYVPHNDESHLFNLCANILLKSVNGARHQARLKAGRLLGGFVSSGQLPCSCYDRLLSVSDSISDSGETSSEEIKAVLDGYNEGLGLPIAVKTSPLVDDSLISVGDSTGDDDIGFMSKINSKHSLHQLAKNIAYTLFLPEHSVFLTGLGVFSSIACRKYKVAYKHGGCLPISLYVMVEQPPGAAKSRCLNIYQHPFRVARKIIDKERKVKLAKLNAISTNDDTDEEIELLKQPLPALFVTNATPEALEQSLDKTDGFFSAVSSEKGLADAVLGAAYGDSSRANNNDVLLNGFDGGYVASIRITRSGYEGNVVGGVVVIAQDGSIERLLSQSNGTGLAERFLLLSETHYLGKRNMLDERILHQELIEDYAGICGRLSVVDKIDYDDLEELRICDEGYLAIAEYRAEIEPELCDGGRYSSNAIRGAAAKIDMQIMKIAANLHLMGSIGEVSSIIGIDYVTDAIVISHSLMESNIKLCNDKGINGNGAECDSILRLFVDNNRARTEQMIVQGKRRTLPFKEMNFAKGMTVGKYIRNLLHEMVDSNMLVLSVDPSGVKSYKST